MLRQNRVFERWLSIGSALSSVNGTGPSLRYRSSFRQMPMISREESCELGERKLIDLALEFDHRTQRRPVFVPPPRVELGLFRQAQADVGIAPDHAKQEPDLFLTAVVASPVATQPLRRYVVAQPVARATQDAHV